MGPIADDALGYTQTYLNAVTPVWALTAMGVGITIPFLLTSKLVSFGINAILIAYIVLIFASLFFLNMLGMALNALAPQIFDSWRQAFGAGSEQALPTIFVKFVASLPIAFAATSVSRIVIGGYRQILPALFGVGLAIFLGITVVIGLILVGCSGWHSCP